MKAGAARFITRFGVTIVLTIGMVVMSQSISFGRWSQFATQAENHNLHAILLGLVGAGLLVVGILLHRVPEEIRGARQLPGDTPRIDRPTRVPAQGERTRLL